MEREYYFVGSTPEEDLSLARIELQDQVEQSYMPLEGELKKTEQHIQIISLANEYLQEIIPDNLKSPNRILKPESVHFLPHGVYLSQFPEMEGSDGFTNNLTGTSYINADSYDGSPHALFKVTLFSAVRALGYRSLFFDTEASTIHPYRMGFWVNNPFEEPHDHMAGFNYAVMERITRELIYDRHAPDVIRALGIPRKQRLVITSFEDYVYVLDEIMDILSGEKEIDVYEVWDLIKQDYFSGGGKSIKMIESVFGRGSLRVIGAVGSTHSRLDRKSTVQECLKFLNEIDQMKQIVLARSILSVSEFDLYSRLQ